MMDARGWKKTTFKSEPYRRVPLENQQVAIQMVITLLGIQEQNFGSVALKCIADPDALKTQDATYLFWINEFEALTWDVARDHLDIDTKATRLARKLSMSLFDPLFQAPVMEAAEKEARVVCLVSLIDHCD